MVWGTRQSHFPDKPKDFNPEGLEQKVFKNGEIIKWIESKNNSAQWEWNKDPKYGDHYHRTPDGKNRIRHPTSGDTHFYLGDAIRW